MIRRPLRTAPPPLRVLDLNEGASPLGVRLPPYFVSGPPRLLPRRYRNKSPLVQLPHAIFLIWSLAIRRSCHSTILLLEILLYKVEGESGNGAIVIYSNDCN